MLPLLDTIRGEIIREFELCIDDIKTWAKKFSLAAIETDADGIKSSSLREVLENWPVTRPLPKFLYTVPVSIQTMARHLFIF